MSQEKKLLVALLLCAAALVPSAARIAENGQHGTRRHLQEDDDVVTVGLGFSRPASGGGASGGGASGGSASGDVFFEGEKLIEALESDEQVTGECGEEAVDLSYFFCCPVIVLFHFNLDASQAFTPLQGARPA